jgi:integrase
VKCWKAFFRWLEKRRGVKNPMKDFPPLARRRNLPRVLTELEVGEVLDGARTQRDRALILLPLDCGLRVGEVAGLRWRDFGPDYVVVRGKVGERIVPVSPGVKRILLGLGDGEHVWLGRKGPMTRSGVMLAYRRIFARSGIGGAKLGPHTLRHTFGTWYIAGGGNLFALKEIMGHSSVKTTEIYVTLARHQVGQDHALFSPVVVLGLMEKLAEYGGEN